MTDKASLGERMKIYEEAYRAKLPIRLPVVIRVDGKAFHSYTRGLSRPRDEAFDKVMDETAIQLCKEIQGAQIAYVQSDEISVFLHNYKRLSSKPWFENELQKMVSVSAAIASSTFTANSWKIWWKHRNDASPATLDDILPAYFDSRSFILPEAEVCNYFIWRQQDAIRNSIQTLARSLFSHRACFGKPCKELKEMCKQTGRDWNEEPVYFKRGRCIAKGSDKHWYVDNQIPEFVNCRDYINKYLEVEEE